MNDLRQFQIQVPTKIPFGVSKDENGRSWIEAQNVKDKWTIWEDTNENTYYCWFRGKKRPSVGEVVFDKIIRSVYQYKNNKRAVVQLESI
jgi:hypothetical protein